MWNNRQLLYFTAIIFSVLTLTFSDNPWSSVDNEPSKRGSLFYKDFPPSINIVPSNTIPLFVTQKSGNKIIFAALFDPQLCISRWVAYRIGKRSTKTSFYEGGRPTNFYQDDNVNEILNERKQEMKNEFANYPYYNIDEACQASHKYYASNGHSIDKGHLAPIEDFPYSKDDKKATNSYINVAPQYSSLNRGSWAISEKKLRQMAKDCPATFYAVTGIVPSNEYLAERVNIPLYFWTAYCCENYYSGAVLGKNDIYDKTPVEQGTMDDLYVFLRNYNIYGKVFVDDCSIQYGKRQKY